MKVITDYFTSPLSQTCSQEDGKVSKKNKPSEQDVDDEATSRVKKIKIRLADPNVHDSYICEVYDSSSDESAERDVTIEKVLDSSSEESTERDAPIRKLQNCSNEKNKLIGCVSPAEEIKKSTKKIERNHPSPKPENVPCNNLRQRGRKPTRLGMEKTVEEGTKKRPRPAKEGCSKGSILNYFKRSGHKEECKMRSKIKKVPNSMDCVVLLEKLPPEFQPPPKKPKIDPEIVKARKAFLQSGLPEKVKKTAAKAQTCLEEVPFWAVSHVQQRNGEEGWESNPVNLCLKDEEVYQDRKSYLFRWPCSADTTHALCQTKSRKVDTRVIEKLKIAYKQVPIEAIYSFVKAMHRLHEEQTVRKEDIVWSEKYRPSTQGVLGNDKTVETLKNWLLEWKRDGGSQRDRGGDTDSSDEESCGLQTACLLEGPIGSGKTALVYALAAELELNVIEINASSKRSGKKLLTDLQEATRSREVREGGGSALILVEDADIVFEEDEGFLPALQNLVSSTKRPVIMLSSDPSVRHLDRFRGRRSLQLQMTRPHSSISCALLELICHMEGACPPRTSLLRLVLSNKLDLRRSLLEMQFWNGRGGWEVPKGYLSAADLWRASHLSIFGQSFWNDLEEEIPEEPTNESRSALKYKDFTRFFDSLSYSDMIAIHSKSDAIDLSWTKVHAKDSMSLLEDRQVNSWQTQHLTRAVSTEILRLSCPGTYHLEPGSRSSESRWIESRLRATAELATAVPKGVGRAGPLEYLPTLRTMLRAEIQGAEVKTSRRRSRGCHYLRSLGITPSAANTTIISNTFHAFQPSL